MDIDRGSPDYVYQQIADNLRARIRSGELGGKLPSLIDMEAEYGVASMTIRRALRVLEDEGIVRTVPHRGSFAIGQPQAGS